MSFIQIPIQIYPNTSLGYSSLSNLTSGSSNTAIGYESLKSVTSGFENVAVGNLSLRQITTGAGNTAVGNLAISTGSGINNSTAVGAEAMRLSLSGADNNTAIGNSALRNTLTGAQNTAVGYSAGYLISTGSKNTILGAYNGNQGGLDIRTLNNYVVLSDGDGNPRLYIDNTGLVTAPGGFAGAGGGVTLNNQTAAYTVVASDVGKAINCTAGTFTVSLTAAATLGSGFACFVWNTGTGVITIDPNGAETIDGVATLTLRQGEGTQIVCNGTNWETGSKKTMRGYAENTINTRTRPVASGTDSTAIGAFSTASGNSALAIGVQASATGLYSTAIGSSPLASVQSSGNESLALGSRTNAGSSYSTALGANSTPAGSVTASASAAMALGGSYASGADSFAAAVANNTSSYGAKGANSIAIGQSNNSTTSGASTLGGILNTASGSQSVAVGGNTNTASGTSSFATGYLGDTQNVELKAAFGNGFAGVSGSSQFGIVNVKRSTTNATPTVLNVWDSATPNANNMVLLQNNSAFAFSGTVVARQQASGGTQSAAWRVEGLIRREAGAATTTLVASTVTVISNVPGWGLALSADTAIGALAITATGAIGTNIRWVGNIQTSECIYA